MTLPTDTVIPKYCANCGTAYPAGSAGMAEHPLLTCSVCGHVSKQTRFLTPAVLVSVGVYTEDRLLLIKRGIPPYYGKWANPGGFVEPDESLESAAVRELEEETGIRVDLQALVPYAVCSVPRIQQVIFCFKVLLAAELPTKAGAPEVLEARWFSMSDYPRAEMWEPAIGVNFRVLFERTRSGTFDFYQMNERYVRAVLGTCDMQVRPINERPPRA
jgi:ADP-ribose pyrophosphatase YjhB (NUDIX family)